MYSGPFSQTPKDRLEKLHQYYLVEDYYKENLYRLVDLLSGICQTKIVAFTFMGPERQLIIADKGLGMRECRFEGSLCQEVVNSAQFTELNDLQKNSLYSHLPIISGEPYINFYAGAPLISPEGFILGSVCVMDSQFISLNETQREFIKYAARHAIELIEMSLEKRRIEYKNTKLESYYRGLDRYAIMAKTDLRGKITSANDLFCKISEYSREELIGADHRIVNSGFHSKEFFAEMWRTILSGNIWRGEIKNKTKTGKFYWVDTTITPCLRDNGTIEEFLVLRYDITNQKIEREQHRKEIERSHSFLDLSLDAGNLGVFDWDLSENRIFYDERWAEVLGLSQSDFSDSPLTWKALLHPDDRQKWNIAVMSFLAGTSERFENVHRLRHRDGNWVHVICRGVISERTSEGQARRFTGVIIDVSKQKELEQDLLTAQSISKIGSWSFNVSNNHTTWSQEHYKIFEIDEHIEPSGLYEAYRSRIHPDDLPMLDFLVQRAQQDGQDFVYDHRVVLDGGRRIKFVQGTARIIKDELGNTSFIHGTCQDRTLEVERENRYSTLLETMGEGLVVLDSLGKISQVNSSALKILESTNEKMIGHTFEEVCHRFIKEDHSLLKAHQYPFSYTLKTGKRIEHFILGIYLDEKKLKWLRLNAIPLERNEGRRVIITFSDITNMISDAETKRFVMDALGIGMWKANLTTGLQTWDDQMFHLYETSPAELDMNTNAWSGLLDEVSQNKLQSDFVKIQKGASELFSTYSLKLKSGKTRFIGARSKVLRDENNNPIALFGINWDKTKEVDLEHELEDERARALHNAKLASIGELAAGVGHEINNPLAIISGHINILDYLLKQDKVDYSELSGKLRKMDSAVERISHIVKGLRTFARADNSQISEFNLVELTSETFEMLKDIYRKDEVTLKFLHEGSKNFVSGNRGRLQQVLFNLISNARDATAGKPNREILIRVFNSSDEMISLEIKDNGTGIKKELQDKIFEPFFTTKEVNKGTGIGLAMVSSIIKEHHGKVRISSEVGEGTSFFVEIPCLDKTLSMQQEQVTLIKPDMIQKKIPRVLVVDDESEIREVLYFKLKKIADEVILCPSVEEAMDVLKNKTIDLVLSDIQMPGKTGFDFLRELRSTIKVHQPKFLFITGGIDLDKEQFKFINDLSDGFLMKPFKEDAILSKFKELFLLNDAG